tara:strand:- start:4766 stop:5074 length:309 start_codon:yes stop_codon:yes gene_type:complete
MTKLTIDSYAFTECLQNDIMNCRPNAHKELIDYIDAKLAEAYEQGKKDAAPQQPEQEPVAWMYQAITGNWRVTMNEKWAMCINNTEKTVIPLVTMLPKEPTC